MFHKNFMRMSLNMLSSNGSLEEPEHRMARDYITTFRNPWTDILHTYKTNVGFAPHTSNSNNKTFNRNMQK